MLAKATKEETSITKNKSMYSLTFSYDFEYENDVVFFAHSFPYTATEWTDYLDKISKKCEKQDFYRRDILLHTLGGRPWYMLTITENISSYMTSSEEK